MVRKTGKLLFFLLVIFSTVCCGNSSEIFLSATGTDHTEFDYVGTNQPFYLTVTTKNMGDFRVFEDDVPASASCVVVRNGTSQSTSIINGKRDESFTTTFLAHPSKEGKFTFGPISGVAPDGSEIVSNIVTVKVSDHPLVHEKKHKPFMFESFVDKNKVFVNQKVIVTYRFYYRRNFDQLQVSEQKYSNCTVGLKSNASAVRTKNIDGQEFNYREWTVELYPQSAGVVKILPARVQYFDASSVKSNAFGLLFGGFLSDKKELYAKTLELEVMPLPEHPEGKEVKAVGNFDEIYFEVSDVGAEVGNGVTAKYGIVGDGNLFIIPDPQLNLPESIRCYASTSSIHKVSDLKKEKSFEFIVQGSEPGAFEIPAQQFDFFDPILREYRSLWTDPISMEFTGQALAQNEKQEQIKEQEIFGPEVEEDLFEDWQMKNIYSGSSIHEQKKRGLSPGAFGVLLLLFVLFLVTWNLYRVFCRFVPSLNRFLRFQNRYALFRLLMIRKMEDPRLLYNLFGEILKFHGVDIYQSSGVEVWEKNGASKEKIMRWQQFVDRLNCVLYADDNRSDYGELDKDARLLIKIFYKQLMEARKKSE